VTDQGWSVGFYVEDSGRDPVGDFLRGLEDRTQARFLRAIEQLQIRNVQAREPLVRHLEGKLWELRVESQTNIYRLLYFFFVGRRIVFVHGFQKKTQRTPRAEIELASRRMARFVERMGGE
jgi:phage-related protein